MTDTTNNPAGRPAGDENGRIQCPGCGSLVANLPNHIRRAGCGGGA